MTIKIKELNIKKDEFTKSKDDKGWGLAGISKLDGKIKVNLSEGIVTGSGEIDVFEISEKLRNKLYDVLSEIEGELSGEETIPHETESNEFQQLEDALENVGKLFGSAVFVGNKEYKNALKSKGFNLL